MRVSLSGEKLTKDQVLIILCTCLNTKRSHSTQYCRERWCVVATNTCGAIAGSDALSAHGRILYILLLSLYIYALYELLLYYSHSFTCSHATTSRALLVNLLLLLALHEQAVFPRSRIVLTKLQRIRHLLRVFPFHVKESGV